MPAPRVCLRVAALLAALSLCPACVTTGPPDVPRLDHVLERYFTPSAAAALRDVPLHYGNLHGFGGFAIGDDAGSRLAGVALGFGNRRQVVIEPAGDEMTIFHEYIHQAQYLGMIDTRLFMERFAVLRDDPSFARIPGLWESYIRRRYGRSTALAALVYGRGVTRELIAYTIQGWMEGWYELPDYFLDVYRDTVRLESRHRH